MPHLDAKALEDDLAGCAFLYAVLKPDPAARQQAEATARTGLSPARYSQFLCQPVFAQRSIAAHLGRELRAVYATLIAPGIPEHLADDVARLEAAG
jgi:hypothetical protein